MTDQPSQSMYQRFTFSSFVQNPAQAFLIVPDLSIKSVDDEIREEKRRLKSSCVVDILYLESSTAEDNSNRRENY